MSPQRDRREVIPAEREGPERQRVAWQRAEERTQWERIQQWREKDLGKLERRSKWEWSELYGRQGHCHVKCSNPALVISV